MNPALPRSFDGSRYREGLGLDGGLILSGYYSPAWNICSLLQTATSNQ